MAILAAVVDYAVPPGRYERQRVRSGLIHPPLLVAAAALTAGCFVAFDPARAAVAAFFCAALALVTATDLEYRVIPNRIVYPAAAVVLAGMTAVEPSPEWAIAAFGAFAFFFLAALVHPAGMGMGDVKLAFLMGAALGRTVPVAIFVGLLAAVVPSLAILLRHGAAGRKMGFPLGPFLALGSAVALFAGDDLAAAYLD